jgi:hypothetical protein
MSGVVQQSVAQEVQGIPSHARDAWPPGKGSVTVEVESTGPALTAIVRT